MCSPMRTPMCTPMCSSMSSPLCSDMCTYVPLCSCTHVHTAAHVLIPAIAHLFAHPCWATFVYFILWCDIIWCTYSYIIHILRNNENINISFQTQNEVLVNLEAKKCKLSKAFDLLKTWSGGRYILTEETWHDLIIQVDTSRNKTQRDLMMYVLDQNGNNNIGEYV